MKRCCIVQGSVTTTTRFDSGATMSNVTTATAGSVKEKRIPRMPASLRLFNSAFVTVGWTMSLWLRLPELSEE